MATCTAGVLQMKRRVLLYLPYPNNQRLCISFYCHPYDNAIIIMFQ